MSVSYGQFSLNRDCIAHWLHVHFAPLLLQNPSIIFFLSLVIVGPINSLQCGTIHVKVLFMSGSDPIFPRLCRLDLFLYRYRQINAKSQRFLLRTISDSNWTQQYPVDSTLTQMAISVIKLSTHIPGFHGRLDYDSTHLSQSRVKFHS